MKQKKLAIVIPAYKSTFLPAALDSIAAQTCQDFTLYVGDDCSPNPIKEIVDRYKSKIDIVYHRFETNLGGKDLVAQWERCIDMTQDEKWIWLFSDDDVMDVNCVEVFYKSINANSQLYHFNLKVCDEYGNVTKSPQKYPTFIKAKEFVDMHLSGKLLNAVVEFIFSRQLYIKGGRFQNFDLAWGSDFLTWVKFSALNGGITTIQGPCVFWRLSGENISPNTSHDIVVRKLNAIADNYVCLKAIFKKYNFNYGFRYDFIVFKVVIHNRKYITRKDGENVLNSFYAKQQLYFARYFLVFFWLIVKWLHI